MRATSGNVVVPGANIPETYGEYLARRDAKANSFEAAFDKGLREGLDGTGGYYSGTRTGSYLAGIKAGTSVRAAFLSLGE